MVVSIVHSQVVLALEARSTHVAHIVMVQMVFVRVPEQIFEEYEFGVTRCAGRTLFV